MGHRRGLPRARDLRSAVRRGVGRHGHRHAARTGRDRGGLEGVRDERASARRPGARLARAEAGRHAGAARALPAAPRDGRVARRLRAHRGRVGLRLGRDADDRAARRRRLRPQRLEAVHHERRGRAALHRVCQDRSGGRPRRHLRVRRRSGHARVRGDAARAEDGDQRLDHGRAGLRRRTRAGGEPPRRGGGRVPDRDAHPRPLAPRRRGAGARHRPGGDRLRARVREDARDDGAADRAAPAHPGQARRHGDGVRGRARAPLPLRAHGRRGR